MMSGRYGRLPVGIAVAAVVVLSCVGSVARANVRPAVDVCLFQLAVYGATDFTSFGCAPKLQLARLELGAEVTDNIGITAGAAVADLWAIFGISGTPLSARVYWDFTPDELWVRRTAYVTVNYQREIFDPFNMKGYSYVLLGLGGTYTYYAVTTRVELFMPVDRSHALALLVGVELGGSYILGRHHDPDAEDWGN